MQERRRNALILLIVLGLIAASVAVIASKKARLGLDLKGGVQLIYQGKTTADIKTAYMFIESATPQGQAARFSAVKQVDIKADAYEYLYPRTDYQTDTVALINEMRKGDEVGAARIASGLKQKGT